MGQKSIWNIAFGVKFDKHFSEHYMSMVFVDFDTDLIDYPNPVLRKIGKFPGKSGILSEISGNFPKNVFWNFLELLEFTDENWSLRLLELYWN